MTDQEHADAIRAIANSLVEAMNAAARARLIVEVEVMACGKEWDKGVMVPCDFVADVRVQRRSSF